MRTRDELRLRHRPLSSKPSCPLMAGVDRSSFEGITAGYPNGLFSLFAAIESPMMLSAPSGGVTTDSLVAPTLQDGATFGLLSYLNGLFVVQRC